MPMLFPPNWMLIACFTILFSCPMLTDGAYQDCFDHVPIKMCNGAIYGLNCMLRCCVFINWCIDHGNELTKIAVQYQYILSNLAKQGKTILILMP